MGGSVRSQDDPHPFSVRTFYNSMDPPTFFLNSNLQQLSVVFLYYSFFPYLTILTRIFRPEFSLKNTSLTACASWPSCSFPIFHISHFSWPPFDQLISCQHWKSSSEGNSPKREMCYKHHSPGHTQSHSKKAPHCLHGYVLTCRKQLKAIGLYLQLGKRTYAGSKINCKHTQITPLTMCVLLQFSIFNIS